MMLRPQDEDKCALPRCTCSVPAGQAYCCDACRDEHASADPSVSCPCGHADCDSDGPSGGVTL